MANWRRAWWPGGTWFFTVNLLERRNNRLLVEQIDLLRHSVAKVQQAHPFAIHAWVVLPDHLHCILSLPEGDSDFPLRWRLIKSHFSRALPMTERRSHTRLRHRERGIWQRHYWEHLIRDKQDSPYGSCPYQTIQAWLCYSGGRLAVFHFPSLCDE